MSKSNIDLLTSTQGETEISYTFNLKQNGFINTDILDSTSVSQYNIQLFQVNDFTNVEIFVVTYNNETILALKDNDSTLTYLTTSNYYLVVGQRKIELTLTTTEVSNEFGITNIDLTNEISQLNVGQYYVQKQDFILTETSLSDTKTPINVSTVDVSGSKFLIS